MPSPLGMNPTLAETVRVIGWYGLTLIVVGQLAVVAAVLRVVEVGSDWVSRRRKRLADERASWDEWSPCASGYEDHNFIVKLLPEWDWLGCSRCRAVFYFGPDEPDPAEWVCVQGMQDHLREIRGQTEVA